MSLAPTDPNYLNALAWIYATCRDGSFRDGKKAVDIATQACDAMKRKTPDRKDPGLLDTLACALAEAGRFAEAIAAESEAIDLVKTDKDMIASFNNRLDLFRKSLPYHDAENPTSP